MSKIGEKKSYPMMVIRGSLLTSPAALAASRPWLLEHILAELAIIGFNYFCLLEHSHPDQLSPEEHHKSFFKNSSSLCMGKHIALNIGSL